MMKTEKFIKKINTVFNGQPWYGKSIEKILDDVVDANFRHDGGHSIGQILEHMVQWRTYLIEKAKGNNDYRIEMDSLQDWNADKVYNLEEFKELRNDFTLSQIELVNLLFEKTDDWLKSDVPNLNIPFEELLEGLLQHDIYHLGQIALLK